MVLAVLFTLLPIGAIFALMAKKQVAADCSGMAGWLLTLLVACLLFNTPLAAALRSSLAGIISSFPVSLMVVTSILQITLMEATGALKRIAVFIKTLAPADKAVQILLISVGGGTLLVSVGATPVSILPPILLALGYSAFVAVALPALGFDALCTFSLLGAPLVVYSDLTGTSLVQAAQVFARFLPVISTLIGFGMLWIVGKSRLIKEGFLPCILAGLTDGGAAVAVSLIPALKNGVVLTGVIAGCATIMILLLYLALRGRPIIDRAVLSGEDLRVEKGMSLWAAFSPWMILVAVLLVINFYGPWFDFFYDRLAMPVSVLPGQVIKTRMLWNAYTWVLISTLLALPFLKPTRAQLQQTLERWLKRAPRPFLSAAIFFAIAFVMMNSGPSFLVSAAAAQGQPGPNMIGVLAWGSSELFGGLYPLISAFLGLFGGFISGSEASTIAMLTRYHLLTSKALQVNALIVSAASAVGGGLASVISPAKLQNAAATIDALGIESSVIKTTMVISAMMTLVAAIMALVMAF